MARTPLADFFNRPVLKISRRGARNIDDIFRGIINYPNYPIYQYQNGITEKRKGFSLRNDSFIKHHTIFSALSGYRFSLVSTLGLIFLIGALTSCAHHHHGPRDIAEYIQALERPERDAYQKPDKVVAALSLEPGMVVADIGAGSGYFTRRLAPQVGTQGKVYAVDVEEKMLHYNRQSLERLGLADQTTFILASQDDPQLPSGQIDLVFVCDAYHHLTNHSAYFTKVREALTAQGRVVIIDFYHDERSGQLNFPKDHLVPREQVIQEMKQAGYQFIREHEFLPKQYFLEFSAR
jgi:arsenite methyltransferase